MSDHLEGATREIERLNKIARQFEQERDELRMALYAADEYLGYHSPDSQFEPTGFDGKTIRIVIAEAIANADKETGG